METKISEIADGIYRLSTYVPDIAPPAGFTFNQFLVVGAPSSAGPGRLRLHEQPTQPNQLGGNPSSTTRWSDVPRGTTDEVSSHVCLDLPMARPPERSFHLVFESHDGPAHALSP